MKSLFVRFVREDAGQDLIEYALLAGFISLVAVGVVTNVGNEVKDVFGDVETKLKTIPE